MKQTTEEQKGTNTCCCTAIFDTTLDAYALDFGPASSALMAMMASPHRKAARAYEYSCTCTVPVLYNVGKIVINQRQTPWYRYRYLDVL